MPYTSANSKKASKNLVTKIFMAAALITFMFHPRVQDPFNSPKFWVLLLTSSWFFGKLFGTTPRFNIMDSKIFKLIFTACLFYVSSMMVSAIFSYNTQVSIIGESFRRNGTLTYFGFSIFLLTAAKFVRFSNVYAGLKIVVATGLVLAVYSLVQLSGNDFIQWSQENSIISTLGNTNFAGAVMAILFIAILPQIFISSLNLYYRIIAFSTSVLLLTVIIPTNARQAIIILIAGLFFIINFLIYRNFKVFGKLLLIIGFFVAIIAILGALQIGPLRELLYKQSLSVRGYYWRAGIKMFTDNILIGVGIDNYGAFFKEYRDPQYGLNYGFGITSTNAHNVFIQNFATGGIFVGLAYVFIQLIILFTAVKLFRQNKGEKQLISVIFIIAWLSFQAQSSISIDNIGVSVWGWLFGGVIIGLSFSEQDEKIIISKANRKSITGDLKSLTYSFILLVPSSLLVITLFLGESSTWYARGYFDPASSDLKRRELFYQNVNKALSIPLVPNEYKNTALILLYNSGDQKKALNLLSELNKKDPRNLETLAYLAYGNEQIGNYEMAIKYRKEIQKYDPWNAENLLDLGKIYKSLFDFENMQFIRQKILFFSRGSSVATDALKILNLDANN